jgi:hypothetical protein
VRCASSRTPSHESLYLPTSRLLIFFFVCVLLLLLLLFPPSTSNRFELDTEALAEAHRLALEQEARQRQVHGGKSHHSPPAAVGPDNLTQTTPLDLDYV